MESKRDSFFLADKKQKKSSKNNQEQYKGSKRLHFKNNSVEPENVAESKNKRQEQFNSNRPGLEHEDNKKEKKPFDKKTYRLKKYSKKYKLEQFEEQRKKKLLRNYYKEVLNEPNAGTYKVKGFDEGDSTDGQETAGRFVKHPDLIETDSKGSITSVEDKQKVKKDPFAKAKERFNRVKQDKIDKQKEYEKAKEEKMQKLQEYKKKKQERFKKLSKKTKKGQPVMTGRLELLLEKIQKNK